ncbi:hypothetical protein [Legionella nagasakiensis]|uniref:hypothetical protein n=1 Tax=Legionella nagasakiensis TaxID=535290 RepID=UPI001055FC3C|nr:hypothetical protein [Legionella nagasakiensis]
MWGYEKHQAALQSQLETLQAMMLQFFMMSDLPVVVPDDRDPHQVGAGLRFFSPPEDRDIRQMAEWRAQHPDHAAGAAPGGDGAY